MAKRMCCFLLSLSFLVISCESYRALVATMVPSRSHSILNDPIVKQLLKDGNEVTYIRSIEYKDAPPTLRQIDVSSNIKTIPVAAINTKSLFEKTVQASDHKYVKSYLTAMAISTLENKDVQKLLSDPKEHFDVVIVEFMDNDVLASLATVFDCPLIWMSPIEVNSDILRRIDALPNPVYVTDSQSVNVAPFSFCDRVYELWARVKSQFLYYWFFDDLQIDAYNRLVAPLIEKRGRVPPSFHDIRYNASLVLGYSHVSIGEAIRLPQSYKPIAGFHIDDDIKPLPKDLKNTMDNAKTGVIFFSMGSNLKNSDWPEEIKVNMAKVLGGLNQTVLWKFEEELPNTFENLHISKWFPQSSILSHPNCVLFITHGGLLSTVEALHFGVPFIGIPAFGDQFVNVKRAENRGFALKVDMTYNIVDDLRLAIDKIISDPSYLKKAKEFSFIYHNRPVKPADEISFWVRHVIETRGAAHLRSPAKRLPLYQRLYLDLVAILVVALTLIFKIIKFVFFVTCCNKKESRKAKKTEKKNK